MRFDADSGGGSVSLMSQNSFGGPTEDRSYHLEHATEKVEGDATMAYDARCGRRLLFAKPGRVVPPAAPPGAQRND
ncbi:MAG: hypothetical protein ACLR8Y_13005 [Alistipes indistinctus]